MKILKQERVYGNISFIINNFGFWIFSFPLYSYFIFVGVYSVIFFDVGALFLDYFAILAVVFVTII